MRRVASWAPVGLVALLALAAAFVGLGQSSSAAVSAAQYQYGPISISPDYGPPRSLIAVSGSGFAPSESVDVSFDSTTLATATADGSGAFSATIKVPSYAIPGHHAVSAAGLTSGLFGSAPFGVRTDWPTFQYNLAHTGANPLENVLNRANVADLAVSWTGATSAPIQGSPSVAGGVVYVGSGTTLYAFDASTHTLIWNVPVGGTSTYSSPVVADGVVYVGAGNTLTAFSTSTHALLWTGDIGCCAKGAPTVAGHVAYVVGGGDGKLYAFSTSSHKLVWTGVSGGRFVGSPAVAGGVVYVGADDRQLYAFSASTHAVLWTGATVGRITGSPSVVGGVVYVGADDGKLYAFSTSTHALLWTGDVGPQTSPSAPAVANGVVFVSSDTNVYAFSTATHARLWTGALGAQNYTSSPVVANGVVYVSTALGKVFAFPAKSLSDNNSWLWSYPIGPNPASPPIVVNGTVYAGSSTVTRSLAAFAVPSTITQPGG